jgi:glutathione S-transferase
MSAVRLYGFPRSTYVIVARLVLTHKGVPYEFVDLEPDMGSAKHLALHPFDRVPILEHDGFRVYETAAIIAYIDDVFANHKLTPTDLRRRASMNQWISNLNAYFYPYMVYHLAHERLVFPALNIEPDEKVVAAALPRIRLALDVMEQELQHGREFIVGDLSLADFMLLPSITSLTRSAEGADLLMSRSRVSAWREQMEALPSVMQVRASIAPHLNDPIEHARKWAKSHRPHY